MGKVEEDMNCIYRDPNEPVEARIRDLLSQMTLKEKVGQMTLIERRVATPDVIKDLSIGGMLSTCGNGPFPKALSSDWADLTDGFQKSALESRLGIPLIYGVDAVHGHNSVYGATIFPHNVGLGATRDADLAQKIGEATALEVRASGIHCTFAPCVAVLETGEGRRTGWLLQNLHLSAQILELKQRTRYDIWLLESSVTARWKMSSGQKWVQGLQRSQMGAVL